MGTSESAAVVVSISRGGEGREMMKKQNGIKREKMWGRKSGIEKRETG